MGNFWLIVTGGMRAWWNQARATLAPPPMPAPDPQAPTLGPPGDNRRKEWVRRYFRPSPTRWEKRRAVRQMQVGGVVVLVGLSLLVVGLWP